MKRHIVTTTPADGPNAPRSRLTCETCHAVAYSVLTGDELHRMAHTDTSWHRDV